MAKLRTCKICGKQYEYCGHCPSKNLIEPWRNLYCSEGCREAFEIMGKYAVGKITATEAREKLESFGLNLESVRDIHKGVVADIFRAGQLKMNSFEQEVTPIWEPINDARDSVSVPTSSPKSSPVLDTTSKEKPYKRKRNFEKKNYNIVNED